MHTDKLRRDMAFTILKKSDGWIIALPDSTQIGPYHNAAIALEVAVIEVLCARKQAFDAHILVQDDYGSIHRCMVIDRPDSPDRCLECESFWPMAPHPQRCPVRAAIHAA